MKVFGIGEKRWVLYLIAIFLALAIALPRVSEAQLDKLRICGKRS